MSLGHEENTRPIPTTYRQLISLQLVARIYIGKTKKHTNKNLQLTTNMTYSCVFSPRAPMNKQRMIEPDKFSSHASPRFLSS